jgi:hypothetical protein
MSTPVNGSFLSRYLADERQLTSDAGVGNGQVVRGHGRQLPGSLNLRNPERQVSGRHIKFPAGSC